MKRKELLQFGLIHLHIGAQISITTITEKHILVLYQIDIRRVFTVTRQLWAACYSTRHSLYAYLASKSLRTPLAAVHPRLHLPSSHRAQHFTGHAMNPTSAPC